MWAWILLSLILTGGCWSCHLPYRTINGTCNNLLNTNYGIAYSARPEGVPEGIFYRTEPHEYLNLAERTSPRDSVANPVVVGHDLTRYGSSEVPRAHADKSVLFASAVQFMMHDISHTGFKQLDIFDAAGFNIQLSQDGQRYVLGDPTHEVVDKEGVPQHANNATAYLDLSMVYGHTDIVHRALRQYQGGLLRVNQGRHLYYKYPEPINRDICLCINTTTGQPFNRFLPDGSNTVEVKDLFGPGFRPEPYPAFGICVSPASFGFPSGPAVLSCPGPNGPPRVLTDVFCSINQTALHDPARANLEWEIPAGDEWPPFMDELPYPLPFSLTNTGTSNFSEIFVTGDDRSNENFGLFILHNLFLREHNRLARNLSVAHPDWTDEQLFQEARKRNIAVWQHIVINELLPETIGQKAFQRSSLSRPYRDHFYDPELDPRTGNLFSVVAMRWGHSTVNKNLYPIDPATGQLVPRTRYPVFEHFLGLNNPGKYDHVILMAGGQSNTAGHIHQLMPYLADQLVNHSRPDDAILLGLIDQKIQALDRHIEDSINSFDVANCFSPSLFVSVPASTVFRGRQHGLPNYHEIRKLYTRESLYGRKRCPKHHTGNDPLECFLLLTKNVEYAQRLQSTFHRLDNIDPFLGIILETELNREEDALVGRTATAIILEQFERARVTDRFWYQSSIHGFTPAERVEIESTRFRDLLMRHHYRVAHLLPDNVWRGSSTRD